MPTTLLRSLLPRDRHALNRRHDNQRTNWPGTAGQASSNS
jgi:hypothetical protein